MNCDLIIYWFQAQGGLGAGGSRLLCLANAKKGPHLFYFIVGILYVMEHTGNTCTYYLEAEFILFLNKTITQHLSGDKSLVLIDMVHHL